jgi:exodeoxyribonuclease VII small subunit
MSQPTTTAPEKITFEAGYEELKAIVARLGEDDVPVHEMFEGLRRGKGLENSLRAYLTELEGELTEIEASKGLPEFDIVAPSATVPASEAVASAGEHSPAPNVPPASTATPGSTDGEDDIPF